MSRLDGFLELLSNPGWKKHLPSAIGFPLFILWFLVGLVLICPAILAISLWDMWKAEW